MLEASQFAPASEARQLMASTITTPRWERTLSGLWIGNSVAAMWDTTFARYFPGVTPPLWEPIVIPDVEPIIEAHAASIVRTSKDAVLSLELETAKADEDTSLIRRAARRLYALFGSTRAGRIAVTETLQATARVQHLAARAAATVTRREVFKIWTTVGDQRVRSSHVDADGQVRRLNEFFDLIGGALMHPGDPTGPIEETIDCRCWETYETQFVTVPVDEYGRDLYDGEGTPIEDVEDFD